MQIRNPVHRSLHRLRDTIVRTARKAEGFEGTCLGPAAFGILVIGLALMVLMTANARAALNEDLPTVEAAAPATPDSARRLIRQARMQWDAAQHAAVVDTLSTVIRLPALPRKVKASALLDRGNAYLRLGEASEALADFDASLRLAHPEPERVHLLTGMAYEMRGDLQKAAWSYIQALKAAPTDEAINRHVMHFFSAR